VADLDEVIHQPLRLKLMAALHASPQPLEVSWLKRLLGATDGNLGSHIATLEKSGYVAVAREGQGRGSRSRISLTAAGRRAFRNHLDYLRELVDAASSGLTAGG
jgi:DNA-binding MarR family transcriptional regulator